MSKSLAEQLNDINHINHSAAAIVHAVMADLADQAPGKTTYVDIGNYAERLNTALYTLTKNYEALQDIIIPLMKADLNELAARTAEITKMQNLGWGPPTTS